MNRRSRPIRRWALALAAVVVGALSLLLLELEHRRSMRTLRWTVSAVDNLTRARVLVMEAFLAAEQIEGGDPTAEATRALAALDMAADVIDDFRDGRTALLEVPSVDAPRDSSLVARTDSLAAAIGRVRARVASNEFGTPVQRRLVFDFLESRAQALERYAYAVVSGLLAREEASHRFWLGGWAFFLVLAGTIVTAARLARSRAEEGRRQAELSRDRSVGIFQALVEGSNEILTVFAPDGTIQYESPAVERVLGYPAAERTGSNGFDFIHPDDRARVAESFKRTLSSDTPASVECRIRHRDGRWRVVSCTGANLLDDPTVGGIVVNSRDVTQLYESELRVRQMQKMDAVGRLAGGIAHDFNNLLAVILGNASMALTALDPDSPVREDVEEIEFAAERAANLTRQLLVFSRQEVLRPEVVDVNSAIEELEKLLRRTLGEDIEFITILEPSAGRIRIDPGQLQQVLMNLAINARDAMPYGGKLITETRNVALAEQFGSVSGEPVRPGDYVLLSVSDTGTGISEEVRHRIFEPFFTTKAEGKGTGLGLSTVYGIVQQTGGYVWVYSEPGQGTTFKLYFPRVPSNTSAEDAGAGAKRNGRTGRILLVEDEIAVRSTARRLLERMGHTVLEAGNGEEALRVAERHAGEIDVLLTDVVMPRMGGRELAEKVHERWPHVAVVFSSGYTDEAVVRHGVLSGSAAFLQKPYQPSTMAERIHEALEAAGA